MIFAGARDLLDDPPRRSRVVRDLAQWPALLGATAGVAWLASDGLTWALLDEPLLIAFGVAP